MVACVLLFCLLELSCAACAKSFTTTIYDICLHDVRIERAKPNQFSSVLFPERRMVSRSLSYEDRHLALKLFVDAKAPCLQMYEFINRSRKPIYILTDKIRFLDYHGHEQKLNLEVHFQKAQSNIRLEPGIEYDIVAFPTARCGYPENPDRKEIALLEGSCTILRMPVRIQRLEYVYTFVFEAIEVQKVLTEHTWLVTIPILASLMTFILLAIFLISMKFARRQHGHRPETKE